MNLGCCNVIAMILAGVGVNGSLPQDQDFPAKLESFEDPMNALFGALLPVKLGMTRDHALAALKKDGYAVKVLDRRGDLWESSKTVEPWLVRTFWVTFKGDVVAAADDFYITN